MSKINIIVSYSATSLLVALSILCGCENGDAPQVDRYKPWVPLYNLKLAYNYGEPEALEGIFASDYKYIAEETPGGFPDDWGVADEAIVIEEIAGSADAVVLEMGTSHEAIGSPKREVAIYATPRLEARLRVYISDGSCLYTRGYCVFDMSKENPDTPWRIKTWYDETSATNEFIPDDETVKPMSWADIKYYFYSLHETNIETTEK